jgi:protoporphyrinogen/coproporphyrinogen III oxidase
MSGDRRRLVIVGGGITGLAAAWEATGHSGTEVVVLEATERPGGKIRTSELPMGDGTSLSVDEGADAFLARVPDAVGLCRELGLAGELTQPAIGRARVLVDGRLLDMPGGTVLGVPTDTDALAATGILSDDGLRSVCREPEQPMPHLAGDVAIGRFLGDRFGRELVERLVGPLIGGINAGDVDELSLRAVTPQLAEAAEDGGSLMEALRRRQAADATGSTPVFHGLRSGTGRLVDELSRQLRDRGVQLRTDSPVARVVAEPGRGYRLEVPGGPLTADAVLLATPAPAAARLLSGISPAAAEELGAITHSSVVLVTLVYDRQDVPGALDASGFLVPRTAGLLMTAASWGSSKWAHWDDGRHVILRVSAGNVHDDRPIRMSDAEVVEALGADLRSTMDITAPARTARVTRYPDGFAQYTVGHLGRVGRIESALAAEHPSIAIAGAAYRGVGIPACIRQGREAAARLCRQQPTG